MAGRKPLPTKIKELRGTTRSCREKAQEPEYPRGLLEAPSHLAGLALDHWHEIYPKLEKAGVMSSIDAVALAAYCVAYQRWRVATDEVDKFGPVIESPSGYPIQSPYLAIANKAFEQMLKLMSEFGMTPSSRTRVSANKREPEKKGFSAL